MTSREQFEAWVETSLGLNTQRLVTGDYQSFGVSCAWAAWQASREAVEVQLPDTVANTGTLTSGAVLSYKRECREAIEAAGIRVTP